MKCFVGHPGVNSRQLKWEDLESFPEKVSDADLRIISTPCQSWEGLCGPGSVSPSFQDTLNSSSALKDSIRRKGQLSFKKECPKYAAREENRESGDTGENTG